MSDMFRATFLTEAGTLKPVYLQAESAHHARSILAGYIGRQHRDAVSLVNLALVPRPARHVAEPVRRNLHATMLLTGIILLLLLLALLFH